MHRALSTYLFVNHRLTTVWLDRIWRADIPLVEIFCARPHFDYQDRGQIAELRHWFRDAELKLHSLHSPLFSDDVWGRSGPNAVVDLTELTKARRRQAVDEVKRVLEIAEMVPFRYLVQQLGSPGDEFDEHRFDAAFSSLEELSVFARQRGVEVLIQNTANDVANAQRLLTFFELTHMDLNVGFDTGHAHLRGSVETEFRLLKTRIRSISVHDNHGKEDEHLLPVVIDKDAGPTIHWRSFMDQLSGLPGDIPLLLEPREIPDMALPLDAVRQAFDKLEGLKLQQ